MRLTSLAILLLALAPLPALSAPVENSRAGGADPAVLARAASRVGQWASAARLWRALTVADPMNAEAWAMLGDALARAGAPGDAVAALGRAEVLEAGRPGLALARGRAELALGHGEAAMAAFARAVTQAPQDPRGWTGLGVARDLAGDHAGALVAYDRALAIDPLNVAARHNLALSRQLGGAGVTTAAAGSP